MPAAGRGGGLSEMALMSSAAGSDSASPMVTGMAAVAVLVVVVWLAMAAIVGGVFAEPPPGTVGPDRNLVMATSAEVVWPLLLISLRKLEPSTGRLALNLTTATSAEVTV